MIPKTLSATSLDVATKCMARWEAEYFNKADSGESGYPAMLGSACHGALEHYVRAVYMDKVSQPDLSMLLDLFKMQYIIIFDVAHPEGEWYKDGIEMLTRWFERTDLSNVTVLSVEEKEPFVIPVKAADGTLYHIPFNYIFDRLDQLDEDTYRVVDYKSVRWGYGPDELKMKLQARAYAVAAQIKFPHAKRIWVQFDLLRHDSVGIVFSYEENANTWRYIRKWAKKIVDMDSADVTETINDECKFCIRKAVCQELAKNRTAGGIAGLDLSDLIDRRSIIQGQIAGLKALADELDAHFKDLAQKDDLEVLASDQNEVYWTRSKRRTISRIDALEKILGPVLMARVGKTDVTLGKLDPLLKKNANELTSEQKAQVTALFVDSYGEPTAKTRPVNKIDGG